MGAYQPGSNPAVDLSIDMRESMLEFLQQGLHESVDFETSTLALNNVLKQGGVEF